MLFSKFFPISTLCTTKPQNAFLPFWSYTQISSQNSSSNINTHVKAESAFPLTHAYSMQSSLVTIPIAIAIIIVLADVAWASSLSFGKSMYGSRNKQNTCNCEDNNVRGKTKQLCNSGLIGTKVKVEHTETLLLPVCLR